METTQTTTRAANPACTACNGSGEDKAFGGTCTECWVDADRDALIAARYDGIAVGGKGDRAYAPGERMDGRTFGASTSNDHAASGKQINFLSSLLDERMTDQYEVTETIRAASHAMQTGGISKKQASAWIKELLGMERKAAAPRMERTNRYPGDCVKCGQTVEAGAGLLYKAERNGRWLTEHRDGGCGTVEPKTAPDAAEEPTAGAQLDLTVLHGGKYGIPGSDTRLKLQIDVVTTGKWSGWVFVKDAAEYGHGKRYGRQRPGGLYEGDVIEELQAILANEAAAFARYGALTSHCGVCSRPLEDADSVARGIGPVCAQKFA